MRADLHCHSSFSDGTYTPTQIVHLCKKKEFDVVTLTDHDTCAGFSEMKASADREGLLSLSGIEISSIFEGLTVHVLGYAFDTESQKIQDYEAFSQEARVRRAKKIIGKLHECGVSLTEEELFTGVLESHSIGRPHIARLLVQKKYATTLREIFELYLGDGKPAYVPTEKIAVSEAVQLIHAAGGYAILAHPHLLRNKKVVYSLLDQFSFDGLEAFYSRFERKKNAPWIQLARERNLLTTGGSDFHGEERDETLYGSAVAPEETVRLFLSTSRKE